MRSVSIPGTGDEDPSSARQQWAVCGLSKAPLQEPVVADDLGNWYNMETLLAHLLGRKRQEGARRDKEPSDPILHIRNLKDVTRLKLKRNPAFESQLSTKLGAEEKPLPFICPLSSKVLSGSQRSVFLKTCGCAFTESALRAVVAPSSSHLPETGTVACPECSKPFNPPMCWFRVVSAKSAEDKADSDLVTLHPPEQERKERLEFLYAHRKRQIERKSKRKHRLEDASEAKRSKRKQV